VALWDVEAGGGYPTRSGVPITPVVVWVTPPAGLAASVAKVTSTRHSPALPRAQIAV
jgi:hypothetical protein